MPIKRTTVLIDDLALFEAQCIAAASGIPRKVAQSNSAFIRYLVEDFSRRKMAGRDCRGK